MLPSSSCSSLPSPSSPPWPLKLFVLLWLSIIILLLFHEYHHHFKAKIYKNNDIMQASDRSLSSSSHDHLHYDQKKKKKKQLQNRSMSRKVLAKSNKFDFYPFFKNHHLHPQHLQPPDPLDTQIDPRYGVEKRRVPTGPNPLHH